MKRLENSVLYIDITHFYCSRITTGIQRVIKEFLQRALVYGVDVKVLFFNEQARHYEELPKDEIPRFLQNVKSYTFSKQKPIDIFKQTTQKKIFFDIDLAWNLPLQRDKLYVKLKVHGFKIVSFIYDLIPIRFPQFFYGRTNKNFAPYLQAVCDYADLVLFDSYCAQEDFYTLLKPLRKIRSEVVYLGCDFSTQVKNETELQDDILTKRYILFVGTIEPRKEHGLLLEAFEELHRDFDDLYLVFVGRRGWCMDDFLKKLDSHPLRGEYLFYFEAIDDAALYALYKNAFLVTYLSKYEGYGLPVVEALSMGVPTIVSKNSSLVEVGGDFVDYVCNSSKEEIVSIIKRYCKDQKLYEKKKHFIQNNYVPPSWDAMFGAIIKILESL